MSIHEHPDALSLLAADVIALEQKLDGTKQERDIWRMMLSEALVYSHALLRELYMQRSGQ